jgi:hypothetical protein
MKSLKHLLKESPLLSRSSETYISESGEEYKKAWACVQNGGTRGTVAVLVSESKDVFAFVYHKRMRLKNENQSASY